MAGVDVLFVNTYEPVVPLYRDVFPRLERKGLFPTAIVSACSYRCGSDKRDMFRHKSVWMPRMLRTNRRLCAVMYFLIAPLLIMRAPPGAKIVILSQPPLFYIIGSLIARWRGHPYYLHVMDLYPDLLEGGKWFGRKFWLPLLQRLSRSAFLGAEKVVVIGRCMESALREKGIPADKLAIVENWPDEKLSRYAGDKESFRREYNLADKLLVMYCGNMGRFHIFDTLLEAADRLKTRQDIAFVFVGGGVRRPEIEAAIRNGATNIMLLDHLPSGKFTQAMIAGDLHYVSLRKEYDGLMVPSKFYGILAVGRPVIYEGGRGGEVARVIEEEGCGSVVSPGDVDALEAVLIKYASDKSRIIEEGARAGAAYHSRFESSVLAEKYVSIFDQ